MPPRRSAQPPVRSAPTLAVPLAEAQAEIARQIEKGRLLRANTITTREQLAAAKEEEQRWSACNKTLLLQFFSNDALWKEYDFTYVMAVSLGMYGGRPLGNQVDDHLAGLDRRINLLVSVEERLPLMLPRGAHPSEEFAHARPEPAPVIVNVHDSPQAHVNIHGVDTSSSSLDAQRLTVFTQMQEAVTSQVTDASDRARLLGAIADLENTKNKPGFLGRYKAFMASAADHMTVLAPFLPALAQWLGSST